MEEQKKNKKNDVRTDSLKHLDLDSVNAGSSADCTGLIPAAPDSRAEQEAYKELYDYEASIDIKREEK